jgi:hypothetical protein
MIGSGGGSDDGDGGGGGSGGGGGGGTGTGSLCAHLSNFSLNKSHPDFKRGADDGLNAHGYPLLTRRSRACVLGTVELYYYYYYYYYYYFRRPNLVLISITLVATLPNSAFRKQQTSADGGSGDGADGSGADNGLASKMAMSDVLAMLRQSHGPAAVRRLWRRIVACVGGTMGALLPSIRWVVAGTICIASYRFAFGCC